MGLYAASGAVRVELDTEGSGLFTADGAYRVSTSEFGPGIHSTSGGLRGAFDDVLPGYGRYSTTGAIRMTEDPVQLDGAMYVEITNPSTGPTIIQSKIGLGHSVTLDNPPLENNWLFAISQYSGSSAATDWTRVATVDGTGNSLLPGVYYRKVPSGATAAQDFAGAGPIFAVMYEISNLDDAWLSSGGATEARAFTDGNWAAGDHTIGSSTVDTLMLLGLFVRKSAGNATIPVINNADFDTDYSQVISSDNRFAANVGNYSLPASTTFVIDATFHTDTYEGFAAVLLPIL